MPPSSRRKRATASGSERPIPTRSAIASVGRSGAPRVSWPKRCRVRRAPPTALVARLRGEASGTAWATETTSPRLAAGRSRRAPARPAADPQHVGVPPERAERTPAGGAHQGARRGAQGEALRPLLPGGVFFCGAGGGTPLRCPRRYRRRAGRGWRRRRRGLGRRRPHGRRHRARRRRRQGLPPGLPLRPVGGLLLRLGPVGQGRPAPRSPASGSTRPAPASAAARPAAPGAPGTTPAARPPPRAAAPPSRAARGRLAVEGALERGAGGETGRQHGEQVFRGHRRERGSARVAHGAPWGSARWAPSRAGRAPLTTLSAHCIRLSGGKGFLSRSRFGRPGRASSGRGR